jgi:hypothetical protein
MARPYRADTWVCPYTIFFETEKTIFCFLCFWCSDDKQCTLYDVENQPPDTHGSTALSKENSLLVIFFEFSLRNIGTMEPDQMLRR